MAQKIQRIRCISATEGILHLSAGWDKEKPLPLFFGEDNEPFANVTPLSKEDRMDLSGYAIFGETVRFMVSIDSFPMMFSSSTKLYLASSINGWAQAIGVTEWEMKRHDLSGREQFILDLPLDEIAEHGIFPFKFVTSEQQWLEVSEASPNRETIEPGRYNLLFDPQASENRLFRFIIPEGRSLAKRDFLTWREGEIQERWPLFYHGDLLELRSDAPMGCVPSEDQTTFRIFAPRANQVKLELSETPSTADYRTHMMIREPDGSWALDFETDLSSHFYRYYVDGINQDAGMAFCPETPILDPYAKAALCRDGPGIVISPERFTEPRERFKPPAMRDLVIVEAHLRDLLAKSPLPINETDRLGFNGLRQWALDNGNHLRSLGVNAIELQPLQEFDNVRPEEYHWGYMPVNYFAPASAYSSNPSKASGIEEFRSVVDAFHKSGVAVLVDVVCNHVGLPAHLALLDKLYYFDHDESLEPKNWSGCGNDLRRNSPMVRRLLVDSLLHWLQAFDVDGFRFDLAELLEAPLLTEIEDALREEKPSVLLIAEPWSFRGRIDHQLHGTSYSSWNDGFRDFVRSYVQGKGDSEGILHYLKGSPKSTFSRPDQSINYVESHDDHCFIDAITEKASHDGRQPTVRDVRRSRLALAVTFMSQGVPMLAAGQDFLRSKSGNANTYLRGDLNALDYDRLDTFRDLHEYCRAWIEFRLSESGRLLRLPDYPEDSFWKEFRPSQGSAAALLLNADANETYPRLLFAINPGLKETRLSLPATEMDNARLLATAESFNAKGLRDHFERTGQGDLILPPLELGLWQLQ